MLSIRLRSIPLCSIRQEVRNGTPGWRKTRLRRARWMIPPGNLLLKLLGTGYSVCGRDWARHEAKIFNLLHPEFAHPEILSPTAIWLPHLPGVPLAELPSKQSPNAHDSAFLELGRLHRLGLAHGDPHRRNFLYDTETERCRLIDFETRYAVFDVRARALDAAILALDMARGRPESSPVATSWSILSAIEDPATAECALRLLCDPGVRLRLYWRLLGYQVERRGGPR